MVILGYWFTGYNRCESGMIETDVHQIQTQKMNERREMVDKDCLNFQLISKDFRNGFLEFTRIEIPKIYEYNAIACPKNVLQLYKSKLSLPIERINFGNKIFYYFKVFQGEYNFSRSFCFTFKLCLSDTLKTFMKENKLFRNEFESILRRPLNEEEIEFKNRIEKCDIIKKITEKKFLNLEAIFDCYPEFKKVYVCAYCPVITEINSELNVVSCVDFYALESITRSSMPLTITRKCDKGHLVHNSAYFHM